MNEFPTAHRRENTDDRRAAIAMATRALIIEKGFEGLRTRDIAERVGINIATLHYHVPSRQALIELVAETIRDQFKAQGQRRPRAHLPPLQRLLMELEDFREIIIEMPDLVIIFSEMMDKARRDPKIDDVITPLHTYWVHQFQELLADGIADGSFRPNLDAGAGALLITGALGDFWRRAASNLPAYDALADELMRAVINPALPHKETPK